MSHPVTAAADVTLFSLPGCAGSARARDYLERHHVTFEEVNVLCQPQSMTTVTSGCVDALPVIRVGKQILHGYDARTLGAALRSLRA